MIYQDENTVLKSHPSSKQSSKTGQHRDFQSYKTSASSDKRNLLNQDPVKITKQVKGFGTPEHGSTASAARTELCAAPLLNRSKRGDEDNIHMKDQLMLDEDAAYKVQVEIGDANEES